MTARFINERSLASVDRFSEIAKEAGLDIVTLATAWSLQHDFVGSTLIGATSVEQLDATLAAADKTLSADVLAACDAVSREIPYPLG